MRDLTFYLILFCLYMLAGTGCESSHASESLAQIRIDPATVKGEPGYFRVGQSTDGQWWFITPDDEPFFYKGVCAVNRAGTAGGRRAKDGAYAKVIDEKYGYQENPDSFVYAQFDRLRDWGFNALGAWTTEEFFDRGMPYTEIVEFFKEGPILELPGNTRPMPDIFDPAWIQAVNNKARTLCATKRNSKDLVGYFTDNEIGFGQPADFGLDLGFVNAGRFGYSLLRSFLGLEEGVAARERAWSFIRERHENLAALSKAWGVAIRSERDIQKLNEQKTPIATEAYLDDAKAFQLLYAEHYFRTTYEIIKRYDPNHLVLGCRFGSPPDSATLRVMTPWVDVISQNNYRPTLYQRIDYLYQQTGLPVLIGEFSWNPDLFKYVPLPDEPEGGYPLKERVHRRGEKVLLRTATHPATVGYTWYRWVANTSQGEQFSFGLVDREDRPEMHNDHLSQLHPRIEPVRIAMAKEFPEAVQSNTGTVVLTLENMRPNWNHEINLKVRDGQWQPQGFGWQKEARPTGGTLDQNGGTLDLDVEFKEWYWRGKLALEAGLGHYKVELQRDGQYLSGTYSGDYEGEAVSGAVEGYFLPPLPK